MLCLSFWEILKFLFFIFLINHLGLIFLVGVELMLTTDSIQPFFRPLEAYCKCLQQQEPVLYFSL